MASAAAILFLENVFYVAVLPLVPAYAERFNLSASGVGLIVGAYSAGVICGSIPAPWIARRIGFPRLSALGLCVLAGSTAIFGFASDIVVLDLARLVQGIGGGFAWVGGLGWVASIAPAERRGEVMGAVLATAVIGSVVGPLVGGLAAAVGTELVFGMLGIAQAALGITVLITGGSAASDHSVDAEGPARVGGESTLVFALSLVALAAGLAGAYEALTPLQLDRAGATTGLITAVFALGAAGQAVGAPFAGRVSDRAGRLPPVRAGLTAGPLLCLAFTVAEERWILTILAIAAWVAISSALTVSLALVADFSNRGPRYSSRNWGLLNIVLSGSVVVGSVGGPILADAWGDAAPYLAIGGACLAVVVWSGWRPPARQAAARSRPPDDAL